MKNKNSKGFTLIELLVVMVIIGLLAALIVPNVAGAISSAKKSKTVTFFRSLEAAIEQYYSDYKTLPTSLSNGLVNDQTQDFIETLTGRPRSSSGALKATSAAANPRRNSYFSFDSSLILNEEGEPDYQSGNIVDAFGNIQIRVFFAATPANPSITRSQLSGTVRASRYPGGPVDTSAPNLKLTSTNSPATIYKRVVFYSAGRGTADADLVGSW